MPGVTDLVHRVKDCGMGKGSTTVAALCIAMFTLVFLIQKRILARHRRELRQVSSVDDTKVTAALWDNLCLMKSVALPSWGTREGCGTMFFIFLFLLKAIINVLRSKADGRVIETMIAVAKQRSPATALTEALVHFTGVALLGAAVNGAIEHIRHWLIASYREILTHHFHKKFFDKLTYYHATALDDRMEAVDTVIPVYCQEFAEHFAELPFYFVMPLLEAITALAVVVKEVGSRPAAGLVGIVGLSLVGLRALTPPFGKIHALLLNREEDFRRVHGDARTNVEQVAMLGGGQATKDKANSAFARVLDSLKHMAVAKGNFTLVEGAISGCGWDVVGLLMSGFLIRGRGPQGPGRRDSTKDGGPASASANILSSVVVQRRIVSDFHQAVTALVVNVKEVSHLSEFTTKLAAFDQALDSIARGELVRKAGSCGVEGGISMEASTNDRKDSSSSSQVVVEERETEEWDLPELHEEGWVPCAMSPALHKVKYTTPEEQHKDGGKEHPWVELRNVDVVTPNSTILVKDLNITINEGKSWAISGPNGCGKSSVLRVLARLWMPSKGLISMDPDISFIFLPQTPYFPPCSTLAEQIMFPDTPTLVEGTPYQDDETERESKGKSKSNKGHTEDLLHGSFRSVALPTKGKPSITATTADYNKHYVIVESEQRRMREALILATGKPLVTEVIHGWDSPVAGLYNPHRQYVRRHREKAPESEGEEAASPVGDNSPFFGQFSGADRTLEWSSLSGGQQQKLSLSRAFYHILKCKEEGHIPIAVMDECTSQMDTESETTVFQNLRNKGVSLLSVSHRKDIIRRHSHVLQLTRDPSKWRVIENRGEDGESASRNQSFVKSK